MAIIVNSEDCQVDVSNKQHNRFSVLNFEFWTLASKCSEILKDPVPYIALRHQTCDITISLGGNAYNFTSLSAAGYAAGILLDAQQRK